MGIKYILQSLVLAILLTGCAIPSVDRWAKSGIGYQNIDVIKKLEARPDSYASRTGWKKTTYQLENGNWVYVTPIRENCNVHFEVNIEGIIIGYKTEGTRYY